jgi:REP element-mobilizing transposase RayT
LARSPRLDYPGARHHVMNRGARRAPIFVDAATGALFLTVLAELPTRFGILVHAYTLMPNHYHLLLESRRGNLSDAMRFLGAEYVGALNRRAKWDGPVFRGRFRNRVVENDDYWRHLLVYLHLNPLRAFLATDPSDAPWSSHGAYIGTSLAPPWLTTSDLLDLFGGAERYLEAFEAERMGRRTAPADFAPDTLWRARPSERLPAMATAPQVALDTAAELQRIADACEVPLATLRQTRRGPLASRARWVAAWWLVTTHGLRQRDVAALLGTSDTQVGRWVARVPGEHFGDPEMAAWMTALNAEAAPLPR